LSSRETSSTFFPLVICRATKEGLLSLSGQLYVILMD
jgi:hypothetical protein